MSEEEKSFEDSFQSWKKSKNGFKGGGKDEPPL